jgi:hypothetical protein
MIAILGRFVSSVGVCGIAALVTFTLADMLPLRAFALLQSGHYMGLSQEVCAMIIS